MILNITTFIILPKMITIQEQIDFENKVCRAVKIKDQNNILIDSKTVKNSEYVVHPTEDVQDVNFGTYIYTLNGYYNKYIGDPATHIDDIETNPFKFDEADFLPSANFVDATDNNKYTLDQINEKGFFNLNEE